MGRVLNRPVFLRIPRFLIRIILGEMSQIATKSLNINSKILLDSEYRFKFYKIDLSNMKNLKNNFKKNKYHYVINLAAQAGVRYSINNPNTYFNSNILGFFNILEVSRLYKIKHLVFASTSSVYGSSKKFPLKENYNTDKPLSFYAASKKSNEINEKQQ